MNRRSFESPGSSRRPAPFRVPPLAAAAALAVLVFALLLPRGAVAQQGGTITGRVVETGTQVPLASTQVYLAGTGTGTITAPNGRYILLNVPAGTYTVTVERIGFRTETRQVTVAAGQSVEANFELTEEPLGLDEIVVTGTAGAARRREVGNSISQINLTQIDEPIVNVDALLQGRATGLLVTENGGEVGTGASIRLRGNISATMSNQPLIYVDGIRVRNEGYPKNVPPSGYAGRGPNTAYSPLNDINPVDIERVEVIRGPAATTLYGTEASAGVIQIFTKRGRAGKPSWTAQIDQGFAYEQKFGPTEGFHGDKLVIPPGEDDPSRMFIDYYLRNPAYRHKYTLSVNGGREDIQYFLSSSWARTEGVLPDDRSRQFSLRGNLNFAPLEGLQLNWNTAYSKNDVDQTHGGPSAQGIILNTFRRDRNYFGTTDPKVVSQVLDQEQNTLVERFMTGVTATYAPAGYFTNRFTVGYDVANEQTSSLRPFGFVLEPRGVAHETRWQNTTLTLDYVGTLDWNLTSELKSSFSFGGQSVSTDEGSVAAYGEGFPGPGHPTVSSAAVTLGFEDEIRVINAGFFFQELVGYKDRYFLTAGLRVDGNSAFGEDLGLEPYPKVSFSYVLSEEPFWNDAWGQLKLRAAYGQSGRAPGAFDAVRTWNPVGWGGQPAFRPLNLGNPELGPERTGEVELGFDASFLNGRLDTDLTYYYQKTSDALFNVRQAPSGGFLGSQLRNVGKLQNKGLEVSVTATLLDRTDWGVELGASVSTNRSKVLDLGGAAEFSMGGRGAIVEGYPVPIIRGLCVTNPNEVAAPIIERDCPYGPSIPTAIWLTNASIRLPYGLSLAARGEYQRGAFAYNVNDGEAFTRGIRWPNCFNAYPLIDAKRTNELTAIERARCIPSLANRDFAIYPQDFFKLRELSLTAPLPVQIPSATGTRVTLSARNAVRWKKAKYDFADPETSGGFQVGDTGMLEKVHTTGGSIATPAVFMLSIKMNF
ncbi:MAG: TonB-dependent receptor [Gemmatimonadetes bacterium]|nr:TonB-dependent receptor [Gemmatimonadota bacterium]